MAISLDVATSSADATASPLTWTHVVGSGVNAILVVGIAIRSSTAQASISGVTYNGVAMTLARADQTAASTGFLETSVWLLHAPAAGSHTVSASFTAGTATAIHLGGTSVSYFGAQQSDVADAVNGKVLNASNVGDNTFAVTTVADNAWVFAIGQIAASSAPTITPDQTARGSLITGVTGATTTSEQAEDTNGPVTPAGAKTVGFTLGGAGTSRGFAMTGVSFASDGLAATVGIPAPLVFPNQFVGPMAMRHNFHRFPIQPSPPLTLTFTSQTITGKANIKNNTLKTILGKSRIVTNWIKKLETYQEILNQDYTLQNTTYQEILAIGTAGNSGHDYYTHRYLWDPSKWDGVSAIYFEAQIQTTTGVGTTKAKLFNVTDGVDITGSEVTVSSNLKAVSRSGDISANLPATPKTLVVYALTGTAGQGYLGSGRLVVQQGSSATKFEQALQIGQADFKNGTTTPFVDPGSYLWKYEASAFDGISGIYFEVSGGLQGAGNTGTVDLWDNTAGSVVTTISLSLSGTTAQSGDISGSLIDGHEYAIRLTSGLGLTADSVSIGGARIKIDQTYATKTQILVMPNVAGLFSNTDAGGVQLDGTAFDTSYALTMFAEAVIVNNDSSSTATGQAKNGAGTVYTNSGVTSASGSTSMQRVRSGSQMTFPAASNWYQGSDALVTGTGGVVNVWRAVINAILSTTTLQTILGRARITVTTLQTILGKSRITATTTKTQPGKARIQVTTSQTILGKARIQLVTTKTQQGLGRITATTPRTITGKARITNTTTQTITGKARIQLVTTQTIQGLARIQLVTSKTIQGLARVTATTLKTQLGKSRITATTLQTVLGKARVTATATKTQLGLARITATTLRTIQGRARITVTTLQTITGKARIQITTPQTILGKSRITATTLRTITGKADIFKTTLQTTLGKARIQITTLQTQLGLARMVIAVNKTITGLARVTATTLQTIQGKARITATTPQTILGKSRIQVTTLQTTTGKARITITTLKTIQGLARITAKTLRTQLGLARVTATTLKTIQGLSRVTITTARTITGLARITAQTPRTQLGKADIFKTTLQTILGRGRIQITTPQTILGKSRITTTVTKTQLGLGRITATTTKTQPGKANIKNNTLQTILGRARIQTTVLKTILGKANLAAAANRTILGVARVTVTTLQTQLGVGRVTFNTVRTQFGKSRITATTLQTILGKSRIQITTLKTITGLSRITITTVKTQLGKARITAKTLQTQLGRARITVTTPQTTLGKSRITVTTLKTQPGKARITATTIQTVLGLGRVTSKTLRTILGKGNVATAGNQTQLGKADIRNITLKTQPGRAALLQSGVRTQTGRARIVVIYHPEHPRVWVDPWTPRPNIVPPSTKASLSRTRPPRPGKQLPTPKVFVELSNNN